MKLRLELDSERTAPGEEVSGRVVMVEGGSSRSLTLTLGFYERTMSYMANPYGTSSVLREGELNDGQTIDFSLTLPTEAPPSVKAEHSELYWELDAACDRPGLDPHVARQLVVVAAEERA